MRIVMFALAACCPVLAAQSQPTRLPADSTIIVTLGTGTPRPLPDVMGPATAVVVGRRVFLFDAGTGVERRLAAAHLPVNGVEALFFTHLHSDPILGLGELVFTSCIFARHRPFPVYRP